MLIRYEDGCFHITLHFDFQRGIDTWYIRCYDDVIRLEGYDCFMTSAMRDNLTPIIVQTYELIPRDNIYDAGESNEKSALYSVDTAHNQVIASYYIEDTLIAMTIDFESGSITRKVVN